MSNDYKFTLNHTCKFCGEEHQIEMTVEQFLKACSITIPAFIKAIAPRLLRRTKKEHNLLFGYISECWHNWPEGYEYQPTDAEHLRGWALVRIGHVKEMKLQGLDPRWKGWLKVLGLFVGTKYFETHVHGETTVILTPESISTGRGGVDRKTYNEITKSVEDLLYPITGINIDGYKARKPKQSPAEKPSKKALAA